jgi:hypothetical protein
VADTFFSQVRDAVEGFVVGIGGDLRTTWHGRGVKVWFGDATREHYEAQLIRVESVPTLEIGFHAEHGDAPRNTAVLDALVSVESKWRSKLGKDAEAGGFIGRRGWIRVSECWDLPNFDSIDTAIEIAARLADYINAIEPLRRNLIIGL